jgi:hypothetical protein
MALAGPLTTVVGARWVFALAAVFAGVAAIVGRTMTRALGMLAESDSRREPAASPTT